MQQDKQKMETEYSKIPSGHTMAIRQKKENLEFELDLNEKNIHHIKQKLRDLNAL